MTWVDITSESSEHTLVHYLPPLDEVTMCAFGFVYLRLRCYVYMRYHPAASLIVKDFMYIGLHSDSS